MSGVVLQALNNDPKEPREWTPREKALIDWFQTALKERKLPMEPFEFCSGVQVRTPSVMYGNWLIDIHAGPRGPRGHMGTLIDELEKMKAIVEGRPTGESTPCQSQETERRGMDVF